MLALSLGHAGRVNPTMAYRLGLILPVDRKSGAPMAA
jgi:SRSO17 transposase